MGSGHEFGREAERRAADLLVASGWTLLHRNWRWRHKEIDLIARRADLVAFVEVKARRCARYGHPLETVTWSKRRDLLAAARAWIAQHGSRNDAYRFDVIWVLHNASGDQAHHEEGAWQL